MASSPSSSPRSSMLGTLDSLPLVTPTADIAMEPCRKIFTEQDVTSWTLSEAYARVYLMLTRLKAAAEVPVSDIVESDSVKSLVKFLEHLSSWVETVPPLSGAQLYGNPAFREWFLVMDENKKDFHASVLPASVLPFAEPELDEALRSSFGSPERLDYGTGHELSFLCYLTILRLVEVLTEADEPAIAKCVFPAYLAVVRKLKREYSLELAGTKGIWGVDENEHLKYLTDASQKRTVTPTGITHRFIPALLRLETTTPATPDTESPTSASANANDQGLLKMYREEVLKRLPVIRHLRFGEILPWKPAGVSGEAATEAELKSSGGIHVAMDEDALAARRVRDEGTVAPWALPSLSGTEMVDNLADCPAADPVVRRVPDARWLPLLEASKQWQEGQARIKTCRITSPVDHSQASTSAGPSNIVLTRLFGSSKKRSASMDSVLSRKAELQPSARRTSLEHPDATSQTFCSSSTSVQTSASISPDSALSTEDLEEGCCFVESAENSSYHHLLTTSPEPGSSASSIFDDHSEYGPHSSNTPRNGSSTSLPLSSSASVASYSSSQHDGSASPPPFNPSIFEPFTTTNASSSSDDPTDDSPDALPPYSNHIHLSGFMGRKMELSAPNKRAKNRNWNLEYVLIRGTSMKIFKYDLRSHPVAGEEVDRADRKGKGKRRDSSDEEGADCPHFHPGDYDGHSRDPLSVTLHSAIHHIGNKQPQPNVLLREYSLQYAECGIPDYYSRAHVVRVRAEGEQFLLQVSCEKAVLDLVETIQAAINVSLDLEERGLPKFQTLPRRRGRQPRREDHVEQEVERRIERQREAATEVGDVEAWTGEVRRRMVGSAMSGF
ncbi:phosphotyrosyl phosphatase activator [Pseudohyphozyma bogoriensis]|nr:phosphotyrosyl phosphatase activator [Pseudohyphozyma bogoriensis]